MPRAATTDTAAPFAKLVNLDDQLVGCWAGAQRKQQRDYDTGDPKWKDQPAPNGERVPMQEEVNWFVAMPGTTAVTGNVEEGDTTDIEPGDQVRFAFSGFRWHNVIEARKQLPAMPNYKIRKGREAVSDVYTVRVVGWSKQVKNAAQAAKDGFTVDDDRVVIRSDDDRKKFVAWLMDHKVTNLNLAKDLEVTVRRINLPDEQEYDEAADALNVEAPWNRAKSDDAPASGGGAATPDYDDEEPF